jgi:hypothetical protein
MAMMSERWDLAENVGRLLAFREARDWGKFHRPKELAAALAIEAGELQELFLWRDPESAKAVRQDRSACSCSRTTLRSISRRQFRTRLLTTNADTMSSGIGALRVRLWTSA